LAASDAPDRGTPAKGTGDAQKSDVRGGEPDIATQILGQRREYDRGASS
jgi:hypothetical protein